MVPRGTKHARGLGPVQGAHASTNCPDYMRSFFKRTMEIKKVDLWNETLTDGHTGNGVNSAVRHDVLL